MLFTALGFDPVLFWSLWRISHQMIKYFFFTKL